MVQPLTIAQKLRSLVIVTCSGAGIFCGVCIYKGNEAFYNKVIIPTAHILDPELSHNIGVFAGKYGFFPNIRYKEPESLSTSLFGKKFSNPLGIAAGFDKHAESIKGLHKIGFGFVEIGSVTPEPQPGNPKPRVFRLPEDQAVINRYGFNSEGHEIVYNRLASLRQNNFNGIIGVNLGKNKTSSDAVQDFVCGIKKFGPVADYLVINISSPNTPGLRSMQNKQELKHLLSSVIKARNSLPETSRPPVLLKIAPDLNSEEKQDIANVIKQPDCKVDGLIVCNTTLKRPDTLKNKFSQETGGLSGQPLKEEATKLIAEMYRLTNGMTIIGVGGIFTGQDAYEKIKAGASLVQVYTAFVYQGPLCATKIKRELVQLLEQDGYENISEAIGKESNKYISE